MICSSCGELCKQINCKPIEEACSAAGSAFTHFMERPLSTFVVIAFVLGLGAMADSDSTPIKLFGLVYIAFAFYFQNKVWHTILEMEHRFVPEEVPAGWGQSMAGMTGQQNAPMAAAYTGKQLVPKDVVQGAFKKVFMEDFIVLGFFLATIVIFVMSMNGDNTAGLLFFWVALIYSFAWYQCECCAGTVRVDNSELQNGKFGNLQPSAPPE